MANMKNLKNQLSNLLQSENDARNEIIKAGVFYEYARLLSVVEFLDEYNIDAVNEGDFAELSDSINKGDLTSFESLASLNKAQYDSLNALKFAVIDNQSRTTDKKLQKRNAAALLNAVHEILPDYINSSAVLIDASGVSPVITDEDGEVMFNFKEFFNGVTTDAGKKHPLSVFRSGRRENEIRYRKVVDKYSAKFLEMLPKFAERTNTAVENLPSVPKTKRQFRPSVRALRRECRPVDKKGNYLPSYLDFINDDHTVRPYKSFVLTPSGRIYKDFSNEAEYNKFVNSDEFRYLISYLETPVNPEDVFPGFKQKSRQESVEKNVARIVNGFVQEIGENESQEKLIETLGRCSIELKEYAKNNSNSAAEKKASRIFAEMKRRVELAVDVDTAYKFIAEEVEKTNNESRVDSRKLAMKASDIVSKRRKALAKAKTELEIASIKNSKVASIVAETTKTDKLMESAGYVKLEARRAGPNSTKKFEYRVASKQNENDNEGYEFAGYYPKEIVMVPSKIYRNVGRHTDELTEVQSVSDSKFRNGATRFGAGLMAVAVLMLSMGWAFAEIAENIQNIEFGNDDEPSTPDGPSTPDRPVIPSYGDNSDLKEDPEEIPDNPAEEILPPEIDKPDVPEDTTPEDSAPEDTTTPSIPVQPGEEETEDPSINYPDMDLPDNEDNIDDDRKENETGDPEHDNGFWFE